MDAIQATLTDERSHVVASPSRLMELQALRALAVTLVLTYHLWPTGIRGGYVGVDVFFVISGYLTTVHLMSKLSSATPFDLLDFYLRRARRLLPSSLLTLFAVASVTAVAVPITEWDAIARQMASSVLFLHNWTLAQDSVHYLGRTATDPVEHYWSLCVEEQFYLLWPFVLLLPWALVRRRGGRPGRFVGVTVLLVCASSLALSVWQTSRNPDFAYFSTFVRTWELGAGALLCFARLPRHWPVGARTALSWAGLTGIVASAFVYSRSTAFPGWAAILPVVSTVAVIAAGRPGGRTSTAALFASRPVQWIGDRSYPLYLWHWPLVVLMPLALGRPLTEPIKLTVLIASLVLASLTHTYVERVFMEPGRGGVTLRRLRRHRWSDPLGSILAMVLVLTASGALWSRVQVETREADQALAGALLDPSACFGAQSPPSGDRACPATTSTRDLMPSPLVAQRNVLMPQCLQELTLSDVRECTVGARDRGALRVALIGDSQAHQWLPALESLGTTLDWNVTAVTKAACPFFEAPDTYANRSCAEWNVVVRRRLAENPYDLVFVSASASWGPGVTPRTERRPREPARDGMAKCASHRSDGGGSPGHSRPGGLRITDPPTCVSRASRATACALDRGRSVNIFDAQLTAQQEVRGSQVIDMTPYFCTATTCPIAIGDALVYRDKVHITAVYARSLAPFLERELAMNPALAQLSRARDVTPSP